jgi:hypothetical protein
MAGGMKLRALAAVLAGVLLVLSVAARPFVALGQTTTPGVYGVVTAVGSDSMTLQTPKGNATVTFDGATTFKVDGKAGSAADLKVGMHAAASGASGKPAVSVMAYTPKAATTAPSTAPAQAGVYGVITAVGSDSMTLQTPKGNATVTFDGSTTFKVDGKAGSAADLKVGMHAAAKGASGESATAVMAYTPKAATTTH